MAAPVRGTNGRSAAGEPLAAEPATQAAAEAAERATSSVLALDGWGRLDQEPHTNGATLAEPDTETETALNDYAAAEPGVGTAPHANGAALTEPDTETEAALNKHATAEPHIGAEPHANASAQPETAAPQPDRHDIPSAQPWEHQTPTEHHAPDRHDAPSAQPREPQTLAEHPAPGANAAARAPRLPHIELEAAPGLRLLGPALIFGLALGALVGAALRWLELRNAPPPPPANPTARLRRRLRTLQHEPANEITQLRRRLHALQHEPANEITQLRRRLHTLQHERANEITQLRRRLHTLQHERANEIAQLRRRLHTLGLAPPPPPPPKPTLQDRLRRLW